MEELNSKDIRLQWHKDPEFVKDPQQKKLVETIIEKNKQEKQRKEKERKAQ